MFFPYEDNFHFCYIKGAKMEEKLNDNSSFTLNL